MPTTDSPSPIGDRPAYDVVIAGGSLAGCAAAIQLGRAGARVAVVEKKPDPKAFKRTCSHFIQAGGVPAIERLGLLAELEAAGAQRSRLHAWTRWGWIEAPPERAGRALNLRREVLDPLLRSTAAETPGVEMMLGWSAERLLREGSRFAGIAVRNPAGEEREIEARLTVGADGRDSRIAVLLEEFAAPTSAPERSPGLVVPLRLMVGDDELRLLSTTTVFGTPLEVTVSELAIEAFYPADAPTRAVLTARASR